MLIQSLLVSLLAIGSSPASSGVLNLRGVDIGDSCSVVDFVETIYGTQPASPASQMRDTGSFLYTDNSVSGQVTQVLYTCFGDFNIAKVTQYAITVATPDETRARGLYIAAKAAVIMHLGAPGLDSDQLKTTDKKNFDAVPDGPSALSTWDAANAYVVHVSMQKSAASSVWTVVTSVAPQPPASLPASG